MQLSFTQKKHIRKNFGKLVEGLSIPNLIEVQKNSYNEFLESKSLNLDFFTVPFSVIINKNFSVS